MSLILEALRKSEAERQRGRAPGLFVEQRPARTQARPLPAWAWVLGALLVSALLALAWREAQRPLPSPVPERAADTVVEALPTTIAERSDTPAPAADALAPITLAPGAPSVRVDNTPAPVADSRTDPSTPPRAEPAATLAVTPAPAPAAAPVAFAPPRAETPAEPEATPAVPSAEAPAWLPGLGTLAASDRAALPPLKLSMHVFAQDPAQRFVILDGQRLGQGASPAAGVVLEEIRRDGLVLSVNGQRLLLARP